MTDNIVELKLQIQHLIEENQQLKNKLSSYSNSKGKQRYYEKNKQELNKKTTDFLKNFKETNPEEFKRRQKEYSHRYYLKKKQERLMNKETEN
jgi:hypothetical protein